METDPGFSDAIVFGFDGSYEWNKEYFLHLNSGIADKNGNESEEEILFRIRTDGPYSKPPELIGLRLPMIPGESDINDQNLMIYSVNDLINDLPIEYGDKKYPYEQQIPAWIELYFDTAPETSVDPFSLMNLFQVDATNSALSFIPLKIQCGDFSCPDPVDGWEDYNRIQINGCFTNTVNSGVVSFRIREGLKDLRGNKSGRSFRLDLNK